MFCVCIGLVDTLVCERCVYGHTVLYTAERQGWLVTAMMCMYVYVCKYMYVGRCVYDEYMFLLSWCIVAM